MRHRGALSIITCALSAFALALTAGTARAQVVFDDQDWTLDRGAVDLGGAYNQLQALRQGFNNFVGNTAAYTTNTQHRSNDPDRARRRFVWPASLDIGATGASTALYVDNPYPQVNGQPALNGLLNKAALSNGAQADDALSYWNPNGFNTWTIPDPTLRVYQGGFSYGFDPTLAYDFDYGVVAPTAQTFQYRDANNNIQTATTGLLEELPYVPPSLYNSVHSALVAANTGKNQLPTAVWSIGSKVTVPTATATVTTAVPAGSYGVDIYSPGDGTSTADGVIHPNLYHVFVRVSWGQGATTVAPIQPEVVTVNYNAGNPTASTLNYGTGQAGGGGINDPEYSRIFMVDMTGSPGWRHISANGSSSNVTPLQPAAFPFDGNPNHQIVVTLYAITPDNLNDTNLYGNPPLLTADAVRFVPLTVPTVPNPIPAPATTPQQYFQDLPLAYISPQGSILAPTVGSDKIATGTGTDAGDPAAPVAGNIGGQTVYFVARNELVPNPYFNPLPVITPTPTPPAPVDPTTTTLTSINDLSTVLSVPVFYCLDNLDEGIAEPNPVVGVTPAPTQRYSKRRVRWRYVATPDQKLSPFDVQFGEMGDLGNGSSIASPLLANVRCRDGKTRTMVFFVTTNNDGTLGHIYALDPLGNNPFDGFAGQAADPGDLTTRTTNAYWVYPSVRPLLSTAANPLPSEPPNAPLEWNDPNFTIPSQLPKPYQREVGLGTANSYPATNLWGPDQFDNNTQVFDGDIVPNPSGAATQPFYTWGATRLTMPGIAWAPTLIDDPENPTGPQLLIVGGKSYDTASSQVGGRLYAFDAGGRGDFGTVKNGDGVTLPAPGTTQRLWTWPHFGADAFHRIFTPNPVSGYFSASEASNPIQDESAKGYFSGSPVFDTQYPTLPATPTYKPLIVGSADGHMYAVLPFHDHLQGVTNGVAYYDDSRRSEWVYPDPTKDGGVGLGAPISTPAVLHTGTGSYLYFTCDGFYGVNARVYAIPEAPVPGQPEASGPVVNSLYWVYPYVKNPPIQDINDPNDQPPLFPGFVGTAPVAINAATVDFTGQSNYGLQLPQDTVYVVQNDGTLSGLAADPGGTNRKTALYSQNPPTTGTTSVTPMVSLVEPLSQDGLFNYNFTGDSSLTANVYTSNFPSILFGDDYGGIYGFGLTSVLDGTGTATGNSNQGGVGTVLPLDWGYPGGTDPTYARYSPVTLASGYDPTLDINGISHTGTTTDPNPNPVRAGYLTEGDANGQLHSYSIGTGPGGVGETVGSNEPGQNGNDLVDIDIRVLNFYEDHDLVNKSDWEDFMLGLNEKPYMNGTYETPATFDPNPPNGGKVGPKGNGFPAKATLSQAIDPTNGIAVDWGGNLYVTAWGVYHAQPMQADNPTSKAYGLAPPTINVTFNIQQPGGSTSRQVTVPAVIQQGNSGTYYPGDRGYITQFGGDYTQLHIWGSYYDNMGNLQDELLAGNNTPGQNPIVYPWVAKTKFEILPDQRHPYSPGVAGVRVWAQASIGQTVVAPNGNGNGQQRIVYNSPRLFAGQNDVEGKITGSGFQTSPNNVGALGKPRQVYVTNPLGLTVRGFNNVNDMTGANQFNIIGWGGAIDTPGGLTDPRDVLGNRTTTGLATDSSAKSLYAPIDMLSPGSTGTYMGYDPTSGQRASSLYVMDRSNYNQASGGHKLQISVLAPGFSWHGGTSSVMNPLPWEQLPDDQHDTIDYPAIPSNNLSIVSPSGTDLTRGSDYITPPTFPAGATEPYQRVPVPTPLTMTLKIPQYQPANINRGVVSIAAGTPDGAAHTYGSSFIDDTGNTLGQLNGTPLLGPVNNTTGLPPATVQSGVYPAGGYISRGIQVTVNLPGQNFFPPRPFNGFNSIGQQPPSRQFIAGTAVAPQFNMSVQENVLDFGRLPAGAGYTDPDPNSAQFFRLPFAPTGTGPYQNGQTAVNSPWDDPTQLGQYFRPFTLLNTGNVNLVDLRINKLYGVLGATINFDSLTTNPDAGTAVALRLQSDEVSDALQPQLIGVPFGLPNSNAPGPIKTSSLGNIGFVSSLDHFSGAAKKTSESTLYPIANPALDANALAQAKTLYNLGLMLDPSWTDSKGNPAQMRPTLHKPRPGDGSGTTLTIPDVPHDLNAGNYATTLFAPRSPELGIAVPIGTPAGTYTGTVIPYEDRLPVQWSEWLRSTRPAGSSNQIGSVIGFEDGIFNVSSALQPLEPFADPGIKVRIAVRESRLTNGVFAGDLSQIDLLNPLSNPGKDLRNTAQATGGANLQPAPIQLLNPSNNQVPALTDTNIGLYWTTNRQANQSGVPQPNMPWSIAYTALRLPYASFIDQKTATDYFRTDSLFASNGSGSYSPTQTTDPLLVSAQAWLTPQLINYDNTGLFPNTGNESPNAAAVPNTVKFASPATTLATNIVGNGLAYSYNIDDTEAYLTYMGQVDKTEPLSTAAAGNSSLTDTRLFWSLLDNVTAPGQLPSTTNSLLSDPQQPKYSPRPLLVKMAADSSRGVPATKMLYLFWAGGPSGRTGIYYSVNAYHLNGNAPALNALGTPITSYGWGDAQHPINPTNANDPRLGDQALSTPDALVWQSDPYPVFRRVVARNPFVSNPNDKAYGNQVFDAVDVYYTGVLKNKQTVEVLMTRYGIYRGEQYGPGFTAPTGVKIGQLFPLELTPVVNETAAEVGQSTTYRTRDIAWYTGSTAEPGQIAIQLLLHPNSPNGAQAVYLNFDPANPGVLQKGRFDPASGLIYYDAVSTDSKGNILTGNNGRPLFGGGKIVVDARSGSITFPEVSPPQGAAVLVTYTPQVMRVTTNRDDSNLVVADGYGSFTGAPIFTPHPATDSPGNNSTPTVLIDRTPNPRAALVAPKVIFNNNGRVMNTDRLWVLYRKSDLSGSINSTIYLKAQRLMARLPAPVALTAPNAQGQQQIASLSVQLNAADPYPAIPLGPYEVDWVRGRVYFSEQDQGRIVTINYTYANANGQTGNSGNLVYQVAWGDEISLVGKTPDETTPEVALPMDAAVNEGQVAAFKDLYLDKLWVFWSSNRAGTTDLYYETIAPQFYPRATNQQ